MLSILSEMIAQHSGYRHIVKKSFHLVYKNSSHFRWIAMETSTNPNQALEIPEILGLIFQYLSKKDLKSARLVSTIWSAHGWTKLIANGLIRIDRDTDLQAFVDLFSKHEHPPRNYHFDLESPNLKFTELLTQLYEKFGQHMRELDISQYVDLELDHQDQKHLTNLEVFNMAPHAVEFPILPELVLRGPDATLNIWNLGPDLSEEELEHIGKFLAQQSETLVNLHFEEEHGFWTNSSAAPLVKAIVNARYKKLQSLDIPGSFDSETLTMLTEGDVKCNRLDITFNCTSFPSPHAMKSFMHSQAATLEELNICSTHSSKRSAFLKVQSYIPFPVMSRLRSFRIDKCAGTLNFATGTSFPCLQELRLAQFEWVNSNTFINPNLAVRKCKVWFFSCGFQTGTKKDITELIDNMSFMFPNLEALSITRWSYGELTREHVQQIRDCRTAHRFAQLKKASLIPFRRSEEEILEGALAEKVKLRF